jgi:CheY-like chemotaxis protein
MENKNDHIQSVLVVDDDPAFCTVMRLFLRGDGYEVHLAFDAFDAYRVLQRTHPDIILTDLMMPEIDGLELIRDLRTNPEWRETPIVVVSARVMPEDKDAAKEAGADAFVTKPFSFQDLRTMIHRVVARNGSMSPQMAGF